MIVVGLIATLVPATTTSQPSQPAPASPKTESSPSSSSPNSSSEAPVATRPEEAAVEDAIRGHYGAIGAGDFKKAYSYFGPTNRSINDEQGWLNNEKSYQIKGTTINSLKVNSVSGNMATANVDVSTKDKTGTPRFLLTWNLVKENGQWKLDDQVSGQKIS